MNEIQLIERKKKGKKLSKEELAFLVNGYLDGSVRDYQMSAFLMAVCLKGLDEEETCALTDCMLHSGEALDLSQVRGCVSDKHSTGGVGDNTTLVVAPMVAACGGRVAKMSGRGLGYTGGTIDKLESIPGYRTDIGLSQMVEMVNEIGVSLVGQMGNLVPADKKIYALRDVTATVDSLPLIASSIMSKKLASGAEAIVLDVKAGRGAFMKSREEAQELANLMVRIGEQAGRRMKAFITDMDQPLGFAVGNTLEVIEAVHTLKGRGPEDVTRLSVLLAAAMLELSGIGTERECTRLAEESLQNGTAYQKFLALVEKQGGDSSVVEEPARFAQAPCVLEVKADRSGTVTWMDTEEIGEVSVLLGAGREFLEDRVDPAAGILIEQKLGASVHSGEVLARLFASKTTCLEEASKKYLKAIQIQ